MANMNAVESSIQENAGQPPALTQPNSAVALGSRVPFAALPERGSSSKPDHRAHPRVVVRGQIELIWRDAKQRIRSMEGKARNVSRAGALVQCYRALPVGSFVRIRSAELYFLAGCARVQHCSRRGFTYHIGLKFYAELPARYN